MKTQDIRDRVTKLEQHLEASKVKLSRSTQGKPAFKYVLRGLPGEHTLTLSLQGPVFGDCP